MRVASVNRLPDWPAPELTSPCGPGHEDASNLERNLDCFGRRLSSQSGEVGFPGAGIVGDISKNCSSENYSSLASSSRKRTPYKNFNLKKSETRYGHLGLIHFLEIHDAVTVDFSGCQTVDSKVQ